MVVGREGYFWWTGTRDCIVGMGSMEDEELPALPRAAGGPHQQWVLKCYLFHKMKQRAGRRKVRNTHEAFHQDPSQSFAKPQVSCSRPSVGFPCLKFLKQSEFWSSYTVSAEWTKSAANWTHLERVPACCLKWIKKDLKFPQLQSGNGRCAWTCPSTNENRATCQRITLANILILWKVKLNC